MQLVPIELAIKAVLIAAGTAGVLRVLNIRTAAARHAAWAAVMVVMLLLPLWTVWGPRVAVRLLAPLPERKMARTAAATAAFEPATASPKMPNSASPTPIPRYPRWSWATGLLGIYLVGLCVLLVRLIAGTLQAHLLVGRACHRDGKLFSGLCSAPVTVGWLRPVVILPESWPRWPGAQRDAVLIHEHEHARRRDPLFQWLALFNRAVFWFHPLAWWLERRLAALAEEACDAVVLRRGHDARDYSSYLIAMARSVANTGSRMRVWGTAMPGGFLEKRIRRILAGGPLPALSRARLVCACIGCAATSTVFATGALDHRRAVIPPYQKLVHVRNRADASRGNPTPLYAALNPLSSQAQQSAPARSPASVVVSDGPGVKVTGAGRVIHRTPVAYPAEAREKGIEGTILIDVVLAPDGTVSDAAVIGGPTELRHAALSSVLQWHFSNEAAPRQQVAVEFKLSGAKAAVAPKAQVQELAEPRLLERISIQRLSEAATQDLRARLPLQPGRMLDNEGLRRIRQAVHEFDENLTVSVARTVSHDGQDGAFVMIFPRPGATVKPEHAPAGGDVPRRLHVDIRGLSPEVTADLRRRLAVREGDTLDYAAFVKELERIHQIVRDFDPHLTDSKMLGKVPRRVGADGKVLPPDMIDNTLIISPQDSDPQPGGLQQYAKVQKAPANPLENVPIKLHVDIQGLSPEATAELRQRLGVREGETTDSETLKKTVMRIRQVMREFAPSLTEETQFDFPPRKFGADGKPIPWDSVDATIVIKRH